MPVYKIQPQNTLCFHKQCRPFAPLLDYIATVYHGIDTGNFTFNPNPTGDYLLYYGRVHHDKGTKEAVEIALALDMRLIIAGIIQDQLYFDTYVKPFLKEGKIEYIGSVGANRRDGLLGNARLLLHPINFNEPFGLSIVEAMACGTPVVAFNKGSMPELITDGKNGYLAENSEDAIEKIRKVDKISRQSCREVVEKHFTKEVMAQSYIKVYENILNK